MPFFVFVSLSHPRSLRPWPYHAVSLTPNPLEGFRPPVGRAGSAPPPPDRCRRSRRASRHSPSLAGPGSPSTPPAPPRPRTRARPLLRGQDPVRNPPKRQNQHLINEPIHEKKQTSGSNNNGNYLLWLRPVQAIHWTVTVHVG